MENLNMERHSKRKSPTPEQIRAEQQRQAERDCAQVQANLPAPSTPTAVAAPDILVKQVVFGAGGSGLWRGWKSATERRLMDILARKLQLPRRQ
jgi:hypothetical protein